MSQFINITLLIVEIWILAGICLSLHWFGRKIGLGPLFVLLGGLTGALQLQSLGWVSINIGNFSFNLDSHVLLPVLLFSFLIIYVINGTTIARGILIGMIIITLTTAVFQILLPIHVRLPGGFEVIGSTPGYSPRILVASIIAFMLDLILLILIYQSTSNIRSRFPSKAAGVMALLGTLLCDALIFSILGFGLRATIRLDIITHLLGKSVVGLALSPLLVFYLQRASRIYPDSSAAVPRPILDFFTTSMQLEAKANHHYRLLRTLSEVNKLVVNATETSALLEKACSRISDDHEYSLVCITLRNGENYFNSICSEDSAFHKYEFHLNEDSPIKKSFEYPQFQIFDNIKTPNAGTDSWRDLAAKSGYRSAAVLPMHHAGHVYGALHIYQEKPFTLDKIEVDILDNLADDLAYAIVSIEAREQQAILQTASETMRDGLMIADIDGCILYVNSIVSQIIGISAGEIRGKHIVDLLLDDQKKWGHDAITMVKKRGRLSLELNFHSPLGKDLIVSTHSALVDRDGQHPQFIVINMRDITGQREFETQLLNLNRLTTDLSQIQEIDDLLENALIISEEILSSDASLVSIFENEEITSDKVWVNNLPQDFVETLITGIREYPDAITLNSLEPIRIEDIDHDPVFGENISYMSEFNVGALIVFPIIYKEVPIGILMVCYEQSQKFKDYKLQLGVTLAQILAITIQNTRLYEEEKVQHQLSDALIHAASSLNSSLNLEDVFDEILKQVMEVVPSQAANIMMIADDHCFVKRYQGYEDFPDYTKTLESLKLPLSTPSLKTMLTGDLVLVADTHNDPSWKDFPGTGWIRSYVGIPLIIDQDVIGFLNVNSDVPGYFTEESTLRLRSFADHAAIAYRNADLYQQLQEHAADLEIRVQNRTAELNAAKENIEGILSSVPEAVFVLDQNNQLIQANQSGEILLQMADETKQDLFSQKFVKSIVEAKSPDPQNLLEVGGRSYQAMASEVLADEKESSGQVIVFQDVTHFKELDQLKTQFVSDVSHELRTPLTNLTLYLGFLDNELVSGNQRTYLDILKRETQRLTHLIEDLLTFSRIQAGKVSGELQPLDLNQIVQQMTVDRAVLAAKNDIQLEYTPLVEIPQAMGIENALSQALSNLLTNAINYTPPEGKVILQTNVKARNNRNWVIINVIDNGVGIAENEFPHIFERFYRGEASQKTGADGTGLGLAISKELITQMEGDITVESQPGKGSTFTIWLRPAVL